MKKQILHIIDSLARGGAELTLARFLNRMPEDYENYVVLLRNETDILDELANVTKVFVLGWSHKADTLCCALKLHTIVLEKNISLVHAHLYWSTVVARLGTPARVPLAFTVHNELSQEVFKGSVVGKWLERLTYSQEQQAIFVSEVAKEDYASHVALGARTKVVHNFVDDTFFNKANRHNSFSTDKLKLVTVANLKYQKNNKLLLQAIAKLDLLNVSLDIFGEGPEREALQKQIHDLGLKNVSLKGARANVAGLLKNYDAFVLASSFEGFCVAMAEAMAVGLPCLVSNLPVLREVSEGKQLYFSPGNPDDLAQQIRLLAASKQKLEQLKQAGIETARKYRIALYTAEMIKVYERLLGQYKDEG